jgi:hypothetical protein
MLEMAKEAKDQKNRVLQFFAKTLGSPLIENNQGQMYKLRMTEGEPPTEYLYVLEKILYLFRDGDIPCTMKPWCIQNPGQPVAPADSRCDEEPWARCHDKNLCPYALFWYHRGLDQFVPVKNSLHGSDYNWSNKSS